MVNMVMDGGSLLHMDGVLFNNTVAVFSGVAEHARWCLKNVHATSTTIEAPEADDDGRGISLEDFEVRNSILSLANSGGDFFKTSADKRMLSTHLAMAHCDFKTVALHVGGRCFVMFGNETRTETASVSGVAVGDKPQVFTTSDVSFTATPLQIEGEASKNDTFPMALYDHTFADCTPLVLPITPTVSVTSETTTSHTEDLEPEQTMFIFRKHHQGAAACCLTYRRSPFPKL